MKSKKVLLYIDPSSSSQIKEFNVSLPKLFIALIFVILIFVMLGFGIYRYFFEQNIISRSDLLQTTKIIDPSYVRVDSLYIQIQAVTDKINYLQTQIALLYARIPESDSRTDSLLLLIQKLNSSQLIDINNKSKYLENVEKKIDSLTKDMENLKQTINPVDPKEILNFYQLSRKIEILNIEMNSISKDITNFKELINKTLIENNQKIQLQLDSTIGMIKWIVSTIVISLTPILLFTVKEIITLISKKRNASGTDKQD